MCVMHVRNNNNGYVSFIVVKNNLCTLFQYLGPGAYSTIENRLTVVLNKTITFAIDQS